MPRNGATYDSDSDSSSSGSDPVGANRREDRDQETSERENDIGDNYDEDEDNEQDEQDDDDERDVEEESFPESGSVKVRITRQDGNGSRRVIATKQRGLVIDMAKKLEGNSYNPTHTNPDSHILPPPADRSSSKLPAYRSSVSAQPPLASSAFLGLQGPPSPPPNPNPSASLPYPPPNPPSSYPPYPPGGSKPLGAEVIEKSNSLPPGGSSYRHTSFQPPGSIKAPHHKSPYYSPGYQLSPGMSPGVRRTPPNATPTYYSTHRTDPLASPAPNFTPTSPRVNAIPQVARRVRKLAYDGRLALLLQNARLHRTKSGVARLPTYGGTSSTSGLTSSRPGVSEPVNRIDTYLARRKALIALDADMVVRGTVCSKRADCIVVRLSKVLYTNKEVDATAWLEAAGLDEEALNKGLSDLNLKMMCYLKELASSQDAKRGEGGSTALGRYSVGDKVNTLILSVDVHSEIIHISLNPAHMRGLRTHLQLGVVRKSSRNPENDSSPALGPLPSPKLAGGFPKGVPYGFPGGSGGGGSWGIFGGINATSDKKKAPGIGRDGKDGKGYVDGLHETALFRNPDGISILRQAFEVEALSSCLVRVLPKSEDMYKQLRAKQNADWAKVCVEKGRNLANEGDYKKALMCYQQALDLEPTIAAAHAGRGAVFVHLHQYQEAVIEFENAVKLDPTSELFQSYLEATKERLAEYDDPEDDVDYSRRVTVTSGGYEEDEEGLDREGFESERAQEIYATSASTSFKKKKKKKKKKVFRSPR
ncbi:hypothetical protein AAMO2058_000846600 [Amorphochlora amoebiformis]